MTDDLSKRLHKSASNAKREARSLPKPSRTVGGPADHSASRSDVLDVLAQVYADMAEMAERVEALERDR